jgi:predicted membrane channel-forming protein YqfA (hemolysin III family)
MTCSPHSFVSSLLILCCALFVQICERRVSFFTLSFVLLGVSSVIHHSRLDEWWKRDVWRLLDYVSILVFSAACINEFGMSTLLCGACVLVLGMVCLEWTGKVSMKHVPKFHACMQTFVCICVCFLFFCKHNRSVK